MTKWLAGRVVVAGVAVLMISGLAGNATALPGRTPSFKGRWRPVVGAGAVYQVEMKGESPAQWNMAVVGQEAGGYWVETQISAPEPAIAKMLVSEHGVQRYIVKPGNEPAIEMPATHMAGAPDTSVDKTGQLIGRESVATPAGTFTCDHYRVEDSDGTAEVWVADTISPYGLVKFVGPAMTLTLERTVTGATTRIHETPQKFEMPNFDDLSKLLQSDE